MTIARVLPRTTAALDPGAIVASTAEATLRSLWAAPETKTAARGLVLAACAVAAAFPRPFATVASILIATAVVLHASNALARPASLRRGALLLYAAAPLAEARRGAKQIRRFARKVRDGRPRRSRSGERRRRTPRSWR